MKKFIAILLSGLMISGCATIFNEKTPTFKESPFLCLVDVMLIFGIAVDLLHGACMGPEQAENSIF